MIDRRSFLLLTAAAAAASEAGCVVSSSVTVEGGATSPPRPSTKSGIASVHEEIEELGVSDLAGKMARGEITSEALVAAYAARIDALDRSGPTLRAVLEMNPDAAAIAKTLDDER